MSTPSTYSLTVLPDVVRPVGRLMPGVVSSVLVAVLALFCVAPTLST